MLSVKTHLPNAVYAGEKIVKDFDIENKCFEENSIHEIENPSIFPFGFVWERSVFRFTVSAFRELLSIFVSWF